MSDDKRDRPTDPQPPSGPAPWQRSEVPDAPDLPVEAEGEAGYLADDKMSLSSKLRGGGRDLGGEAPGEVMRLCPACGRVTSFIDDTCTNCKHKLGTGGYEELREIRGLATGSSELPVTRILLIALIVLIVALLLIIGLPRLFNRATPQPEPAAPAVASAPGGGGYVGELDEVPVDDAFKERLVAAVEAGNAGWQREGLDCYVYRLNLLNEVEPALSQKILALGYVGGADHAEATSGTGEVPFRTGLAPFFDEINARPGVELSLDLRFTDGAEPPAREDLYLRYGYYYGKEHMSELQPIIEALGIEKFNNGEYPIQLRQNMLPSSLNTRGGLFFMPGGIGYLPVFETDGAGNIVMGSGSGIESFKPANCIGYYLVKYTTKESIGLDLYSAEAIDYYVQKIAPFPYDPGGPVQNMELEPDGIPDGIACVIKDGVLQE